MPDLPKPPEPRRLYQQIADRLRARIQSGEFPPGSRLPAERELAQLLGVSRPSLREALIALEIDGSVEIRMGSGVYVCPPRLALAPDAPSLGESPSEVMQARIAVEGTVALLASTRMTAEALAALRAALEAMRGIIEQGRMPLEHDRQFHLLIAAQCGNSILSRIVGDLFGERQSLILSTLSLKFDGANTWRAALAEHEAVYAALEAGDPLRAEAAMRTHLQASSERWFRTS